MTLAVFTPKRTSPPRAWLVLRKVLPGWERRLESFRATAAIPSQWFTADGRPRCVCCGDILNREGDGLVELPGRLGLRALGACTEHREAILVALA